MMNFPGIVPADILIPSEGVSAEKWAVIACDQFTSKPEYWQEVARIAADSPSTLKLIQPEAFLERTDPDSICDCMKRYLDEGVLTEGVRNGFIAVERTTVSGRRYGLMVALDLEEYDFTNSNGLARPTEGTDVNRLPVRAAIRAKVPLELPHIMVLIDDPEFTVIEPAFDESRLLYDFELMLGGGHLRASAVEGEALERVSRALWALEKKSGGFLYAMGDGNHSLAAAKQHWERLKASSCPDEHHPARYALVELVNLHSPALNFEPIHRVVFDCGCAELHSAYLAWLEENRPELNSDDAIIDNGAGIIVTPHPISAVQAFLDAWVPVTGKRLDYVHGRDEVERLCADGANAGIILTGVTKNGFFDEIRANGAMPRKSFSLGNAEEKRYYMEARRIV